MSQGAFLLNGKDWKWYPVSRVGGKGAKKRTRQRRRVRRGLSEEAMFEQRPEGSEGGKEHGGDLEEGVLGRENYKHKGIEPSNSMGLWENCK